VPGIYFETASAVLNPASDETIATLAQILTRNAAWTVTIEGHTDSIGTSASNMALSERRANAVRARLTGHGVPAARLRAAGYGATRPRESNSTIAGRARNRRVELLRPCGGSR
jgi:outer membrane protein OmpA-like peptidoglycan-associated protein